MLTCLKVKCDDNDPSSLLTRTPSETMTENTRKRVI